MFQFQWKDFLSVTLTLLTVIDVIGSIPALIDIYKKAGTIHYVRATFTAFSIMTLTLFVGEGFLKFLGVNIASFAVAGSIVLFIISMEMILGRNIIKQTDSSTSSSASIVPIAFPLIAGAGTITTILSLRSTYSSVEIIAGIALNCLLVLIVLKYLPKIAEKLSDGILGVFRKIFGVILLAIAVKMFTTNVSGLILTAIKRH